MKHRAGQQEEHISCVKVTYTEVVMRIRRIAGLLALTTGMLALSAPVNALECGETYVETTHDERTREMTVGDQNILVAHATRTYTIEGESHPYLRLVSSFVDRNFVDQNGDTNDFRAGLDEGFIGHYSINYGTGQESWNGQQILNPDEQACAILNR